ncbi:MAG: M14 family zinc carboxypeptidase [Leadbetterella sp.]
MSFKELYNNFENYRVKIISHRRYSHLEFLNVLDGFSSRQELAGKSIENRDIRRICLGHGKKNVLLWSQMHGNEATASMALLDVITFLESTDSHFENLRKEILYKLNIRIIPILNPDGAERFIRRNAVGIDLNRDALALQSPESTILMNEVKGFQPEFSFNLHDQHVRYSVGDSHNQAAIAFLATAYNENREWNDNRIKSAQLIAEMNSFLEEIIPKKVGKFSDEFEPRAFGDVIQSMGSSLVLIESGGYGSDTEKQYLRKLNFCLILGSLISIARDSFRNYTLEDYDKIPLNTKNIFNLKINNATILKNNLQFSIDIGINWEEIHTPYIPEFSLKSTIEDLGDLSPFGGIVEFDATGFQIECISAHPEIIKKYNIEDSQVVCIEQGQTATFVLVKNSEKIVFINGQQMV